MECNYELPINITCARCGAVFEVSFNLILHTYDNEEEQCGNIEILESSVNDGEICPVCGLNYKMSWLKWLSNK